MYTKTPLTDASAPRRIVLSEYSPQAPDANMTTPRQKLSPTGADAELTMTAPDGTSGRGGGGGVMGGSGGWPGGCGGGGLSIGPAAVQRLQHATLVIPVYDATRVPEMEMGSPTAAYVGNSPALMQSSGG